MAFLHKFWTELYTLAHETGLLSINGKQVVLDSLVCRQVRLAQKAKLLWKPPAEGYFKINVDGAFDAISERAGIGAVIRNSTGGVELSAWKAILHARDAEEVKAMACREGLQLGQRGAEGRSSLNWIVQVWSSTSNNRFTGGRVCIPLLGRRRKMEGTSPS